MNACQRLIVDNMVLKAAEIYNISPAMFIHPTKKRKVCIARQLVWTVCVKELYISYRTLGKEFNRNCKTVHQGVRIASGEMDVVKEKKREYLQLLETINISMQAPLCV